MAFSRRNNYDFVKVIGSGGMGIVELWRRKVLGDGLVVAKRVYLGDRMHEEEEEAKREAQVLRQLHHPHIVKYLGSWVSKETSDLIIVQEYCEGGDLSDLIRLRRERPGSGVFGPEEVLRWLAQLAHALLYCHSTMQVLHRDLKPSNIFLSGDRTKAFLGDFGVARALESTKALVNTFIGTETYMSPEVLRMQSYGFKSDVWGLGTIFYELCALRKLFEAHGKPLELVQAMMAWERPPPLPKSAGYPAEFEELCCLMLTKDVDKRPSLLQLLSSRGPLREAVVAVERDIAWAESLLPPVATFQEESASAASPHSPAGWQPSLSVVHSEGIEGDLAGDAEGSLPQVAATAPQEPVAAARPGVLALRAGGSRLLAPLQCAGLPGNAFGTEGYGTRPSSCSSTRSMRDFAAGAAERLKVGSSACSESPPPTPAAAREPPAQPPEAEEPGGELPPRPEAAEVPPWLRFEARSPGGAGEGGDEAAVREASRVQDLLELTVRRRELAAVVERVLRLPEEDSLLPTPIATSEAAPQAQAGPETPPGMPPGMLPGRAEEAMLPKGMAAAACSAVEAEAAKLGARLRCMEALQTEEPDAVDLQDTLLDMKEMELTGEDCGQAVLAHAHRLSMRAEDTVKQENTPVPAMERAVELLEAVKDDVGSSARKALESAGPRLLNAHELRRQVGVRCISGAHARIFSVWRSASVEELTAQVAVKFLRQNQGLELCWVVAGKGQPLRSEEDWQQCLAAYPRGPIELFLAPEPPRQKRGSKRVSLARLACGGNGLRASLPMPILRSHALQGVAGAVLSGSTAPTAMQRPKVSPAGRRRVSLS